MFTNVISRWSYFAQIERRQLVQIRIKMVHGLNHKKQTLTSFNTTQTLKNITIIFLKLYSIDDGED
jgi:hypothetical protein